MTLTKDLERIAGAAATHGPVEAVLAAEPSRGFRAYLVALGGEERQWLVLDDAGAPVDDRAVVRSTASIVAMTEVVGELVDDEPPRLASPAYLDENGDPSFAEGIRAATGAVDEFVADVERGYLIPLR
ncbi:MAG TPA: hypothetical protein VJP39_02895 [Gaiellaceae bacterium]|nr:hypothetical protein [Gaiellaceae bacterium]